MFVGSKDRKAIASLPIGSKAGDALFLRLP
jgi:hypothetical protein